MEDLREVLLPLFRQECAEHVETITAELLALERATTASAELAPEVFSTAFRAAHSLKGAAGAVTIAPIESAMHRVEDVFAGWRDGRDEPSPAMVTAILTVLDAISAAVGSDFDGDLTDAESEAIRQASEGLDHPGSSAIPAPAEPNAMESTAPTEPTEVNVDSSLAGPGIQALATPPTESAVFSTIRVDANKLDRLVTQSGELTVARYGLAERAARISKLRSDLMELCDAVTTGASGSTSAGDEVSLADSLVDLKARLGAFERDLRRDEHAVKLAGEAIDEQARSMRMLPFSTVTASLVRIVRDVAEGLGKSVQLEIEGSEVQVDRSVLEAIKDPLAHLVRNAVDHGIESAAVREAAGKSAMATVTVAAELSGGRFWTSVTDDGGGLDEAAILARAKELGSPSAASMSAADVILQPGFSSRTQVTDVSGRGVGLDVVKTQVQSLRGDLMITSARGSGMSVKMSLPMSLSTVRAVLVQAGESVIAIPCSGIASLVTIPVAALAHSGGVEVVEFDGVLIKIHSLTRVMGYSTADSRGYTSNRHVVVIDDGRQRAGFWVDGFIDEREVLIRDLGQHLRTINTTLGATVMPDGAVAIIANPSEILHRVTRGSTSPTAVPTALAAAGSRRRILVTDDAVTTRTLIKSVLERAGFEVVTATNGEEALGLLQYEDFDMLVSDIEMPIMDGLELTTRVRSSSRLKKLPVILVSAVAADQATIRAAEVGADAFVPKGEFSDDFLIDTARGLLAADSDR